MKNMIKKGLVLFLIFVFLLPMVFREDNFMMAKLDLNDFVSYADGMTIDENVEIKSDSDIADALFNIINKADTKKLENRPLMPHEDIQKFENHTNENTKDVYTYAKSRNKDYKDIEDDIIEEIEDDYEVYKDGKYGIKIDDVDVDAKSKKVEISIKLDIEKDKKEWAKRDKADFEEYIKDICKMARKKSNTDVEITVKDEDNDILGEYEYEEDDREFDVIMQYDEEEKDDRSDKEIEDEIKDKIEDDYEVYKDGKYDIEIEDTDVDLRSNRVEVKIRIDADKDKKEWAKRDKDNFEDYIEDICKIAAKESKKDVKLLIKDEDRDIIAEYEYDYSDRDFEIIEQAGEDKDDEDKDDEDKDDEDKDDEDKDDEDKDDEDKDDEDKDDEDKDNEEKSEGDIDITENDQEWTIIRTEETGYINEAVNKFVKEGKRKFYVLEGSYTANGTIHLDKSNIIFRGESRERTRINQINPKADTIAVENCRNTVVRDITVDNRKFGKTAIVYTNVNHCTLDNVRVYGNKSIFSIFFPGPYHDPGQDMLTKVEKNKLDDGNKILNCEVTSDFYGDSVAFCGQKNGIVKGNNLYGSQLVMYLCRDSIMENNTITDSNLSGIVYALPAYDNIIRDNKIKNCTHAGIWVQKNLEHEIKDSYRGTNLTIARNTIDNGRHTGILVENMKDSKIVDNIIKTVDMTGICLVRSEDLDIIGNRVFAYGHSIKRESLWPWDTNLNSGIYLDHHVKDLVIKDNVIKNTLPGCKYDIYIQSSNDYKTNIIKNNISEKRYNFLMK